LEALIGHRSKRSSPQAFSERRRDPGEGMLVFTQWVSLMAAVFGAGIEPPPTLAGAGFLTVPGERWPLTWHDEFEGDALDTSKWTIGLPWPGDDGEGRHHNTQYASYIMDDDVAVRDGALHLTTQRRDVTAANGQAYHFTEGLITTHSTFRSLFGYFEIRAALPTDAGPGTWPAFWMLADGWPPEMDVIEYWGSTNRIHQGTATAKPDGGQRWDSYHTSDVSLTGWHTFGLEWGPGYQIYHIDGHITNAIYGEHVPAVPHYLLLNSGIETARPPLPGTAFPNDFAVDYVRVYARPDVPALLNGGFESPALAPWGRWNSAAAVDYNQRSGRRALRVDGREGDDPASSAHQTVYGLQPTTTYRVAAWARVSDAAVARLGVKDHGGDETRSDGLALADYGELSLKFTTGTNTTRATVYCWAEGPGSAFFDDVALEVCAQAH